MNTYLCFWSVAKTDLYNWDSVFSARYELRLRKLLKIGHRRRSRLKADYGYLKTIHHKSPNLGHLDCYIYCTSVARIRQNVISCVKILKVRKVLTNLKCSEDGKAKGWNWQALPACNNLSLMQMVATYSPRNVYNHPRTAQWPISGTRVLLLAPLLQSLHSVLNLHSQSRLQNQENGGAFDNFVSFSPQGCDTLHCHGAMRSDVFSPW